MEQERIVYLHDGSFEAMLHSVAVAVKSKHEICGVYAAEDYVPQLFEKTIVLSVDQQQVVRFFHYLQKLGTNVSRLAINGFLSEDSEAANHLYRLVLESLKVGPKIAKSYAHDSARYLHMLAQKVGREAHRFNGLLRFRILSDGLQYAPFSPDCNVIGYCAQHFKDRLKNVSWILHDTRRDIALFWDGKSLRQVNMDHEFTREVIESGEVPEGKLSASEKHYQQLWQSFQRNIANADRENKNLQRQYMPRRYWKYLVENP